MLSFDQFKSEWLGKRVDYDHVFSFQCVDVVLQYIYECYGINGAYGNAIEWWTKTDSKLFAKFTKVDDGSVCKGDIAIFHTIGHTDFLGDGHIGIATGNGDPNSIEILEQNAVGSGTGLGRDAILTRFIARNRLAGVLRPLPVVAPITYAVSYINTTARDLLTTKNPTNWYELTGEFSPLTTLPEGTRVPVAGIAHWSSSTGETHDFYMTPDDFGDAGRTQVPNKNNGISTDDLKELPPPTPYKAPEVLYNIQDKMAEKYTLVTDLLCFPTSGNAASQTTPNGELAKGVYYVHGRDRDMINLSLGNMDRDVKQWINPRKNVVAVEEVKPVVTPAPVAVPEKIIEAITVAAEKIPPAPVIPAVPPSPTPEQEWQQIATELAQHLSLFNLDGSPVHYNSNNSRKLFIEDMTGAIDSRTNKVAVTRINPFTKHIPMVGTIDIIEDDGRKIRYVLPAACYGTSKWYLAPMSSFNLDKKTVLDKAVDVVEGIYNDIRTSDHLTAAQERIKLSIQGFVNKMKKD